MSVILLEHGKAPVFQLSITLSNLDGFLKGLQNFKISSGKIKIYGLTVKYLFQNMENSNY